MKEQQFKEIEHRFDPEFYATRVQSWARGYLERVFEEVPRTEGLENLAGLPESTNKIYIGLHKSHLDYIIMAYNIYNNSQQAPAIAGGDNLSKRLLIWNFDNLIRKVKGYKIIRKPKDRAEKVRNYKQLLGYTTKLLDDGEDILIFPEAGRSYSGRTMDFRRNAIRLLLSAARNSGRDAAFVPVVVSYERVPEDRFFESFRKDKEKNTLMNKIHYYAFDWPSIYLQKYSPGKAFGNAVMRIGEPFIKKYGEDDARDMEIVKGTMAGRCNGIVDASSTSIVAHSLDGKKEASLDWLLDSISLDIKSFEKNNIPKGLLPSTNPVEVLDRAMKFLDAPFRRFLTVKKGQVAVKRPDVINYYSNTIDHYFARLEETADKSFLTASDSFSL